MPTFAKRGIVMKKSCLFCMFFCFVIVFFGCAKTPESEKRNGIGYAVGDVEKNVNKIVNGAEQEISGLEENEGEYICKVNLGNGTDTLSVDAIIEKIDYSNLKVLKVVPYNNSFVKEDIMNTFFLKEKILELDDIIAYDEKNAYDDEGILMLKKTTVNHAVHLMNEDGTKEFARPSDSSIVYSNVDLINKYETTKMENEEYFDEARDGVKYSIDDAWKDLQFKLSCIGIDELRLQYYEGCKIGTETYYTIDFLMNVGGIPIANGLAYGNPDIPDVYGSAVIGSSGIASIQMDNMLWSVVAEDKVNVIVPEKLLSILEQYIESGEVTCSSDVVFERVELMYMLKTDDWNEFELYPVWRIYIPLAERISNENITEIESSMDIVIDAISGEIVSIN